MNRSERNQIRRTMRRQRRALSEQERQRRSNALVMQLLRTPLFRRSRHIALYISNDGEVDLHALAERACRMGKRCYLPVLSPLFHNRLWFAPYRPGCRMTPNRFGIPEPDVACSAMRRVWSLDLVLAPLVAFDAMGNRLGMGGGFYDRTFAYLNQRHRWHKPRILGTAFEFQRVGELPCESWDVPMNGIITETQFYETEERS
ncbi:5-formyltetrahydrofolate cyclo-ligase [Thiohalomonas denitrificans]|nr:5-formyltetrahydrofolate cyclo-ligase [Thiohalomonas denitrificans]